MMGRFTVKRSAKQEGESPFWISFADLMTALMTLFLIVMAVTLITVVMPLEGEKQRRENDIKKIMEEIKSISSSENVQVNSATYRVDLGKRVHFDKEHDEISPEGARFLRDFIPKILRKLESREGQEWTRRIFVEGFTDQYGSYLHNLDLSLVRSRNVVCALFDRADDNEIPISELDLDKIQRVFLVGGYSNNSILTDPAKSRRVELKLEFWGIDEKKEQPLVNLEQTNARDQKCGHLQRH